MAGMFVESPEEKAARLEKVVAAKAAAEALRANNPKVYFDMEVTNERDRREQRPSAPPHQAVRSPRTVDIYACGSYVVAVSLAGGACRLAGRPRGAS